MALQHTPDSIIIRVTLPDGTETAFSFGEYLAWSLYYGQSIGEDDWETWSSWLLAEDNHYGRGNAWSYMVLFRKLQPDDPAVKAFREYALENEIVI